MKGKKTFKTYSCSEFFGLSLKKIRSLAHREVPQICGGSAARNTFATRNTLADHCIIYRTGHISAIFASYSYWYKLKDQHYPFYSLSLFRNYVRYPLFTSLTPLSKELEEDLKNFFRRIRTLYR
jgi:hypothetical protein